MDTTTPFDLTNSFEECVEKCNNDEHCRAFEINMLYLPFQCRASNLDPCLTPTTNCINFVQDPFWKHFAKKQNGTTSSTTSKVSLDFSPHYEYKPATQPSNNFAIERALSVDEFNWQSIELDIDVALSSPLIRYLWFEFWSDTKNKWYKCQKIPFRQTSVINNQCLQFSFENSQADCDVLKQSWGYWSPDTLSQQIGHVHLANTAYAASGTTLEECEDDMEYIPGQSGKVEYKHIQSTKIRFLSLEGSFLINDIVIRALPITHTGTTAQKKDVVDSVYNAQKKQFKFPNDNEKKNTYLQVLKNGGFLWCKNLENGRMTNIFQREHHFCYYVGSTMDVDTRSYYSVGNINRMHQFAENQCSFQFSAKPQCSSQWVYIQENCEGVQHCSQVIKPVSNIDFRYNSSNNESYPTVSWRSSWNRMYESRSGSATSWPLDYHTVVLLVLHGCVADFDATQGCSQCRSDYFEVEQIPGLVIQNEPVFKYNVTEQFCRPQPTLFEHQCQTQENQAPLFCPKGFKKVSKADGSSEYQPLSDFASHNYWTCRTKEHGKQNITDENEDRHETDVDQGFMCSMNE